MALFDKPLFIFEMANNHQGDVKHGKNIVSALRQISEPYREKFDFAIKFQYRNLDTFIHKDFYDRSDIKNVKRFRDTQINNEQFLELKREVEAQSFNTICTPFDEISIEKIMEHNYDLIKIASCSFTDWPLLEKIALCCKPVIASAAGASLPDIHRVVNFFKNRKIDFSLMHCVAEYPAINESMQMNQIDLFRSEFPGVRVGFSTHESPNDTEPIKAAVAKGAVIFEKHVGLPTDTISLNAYSASPSQIRDWLQAALDTYILCGVQGKRYSPNAKETEDLAALQRGVFNKRAIKRGEKLCVNDVYLAFPCQPSQLLATHLSKYNTLTLKQDLITPDAPVMLSDVDVKDDTFKIRDIINGVLELIHKSGVVIPVDSTCEISHHFGLDKFNEIGLTIINCINREYCKKILVILPGQRNPEHSHQKKEETFIVLYGDLAITYDGKTQIVRKGESKTIERGMPHEFGSSTGCVLEEISTTHIDDDSFYSPGKEEFARPRKTEIYITQEILKTHNGNEGWL